LRFSVSVYILFPGRGILSPWDRCWSV